MAHHGGFHCVLHLSIKMNTFSTYKIDLCKISNIMHSFHWHMQNATIPCHSQELLPFLSVIYPFHQLVFHPLSPHLAIYFLVYLSALLFQNLYIIHFWEFCFLPFSAHAQTNVIYLTLLSLL